MASRFRSLGPKKVALLASSPGFDRAIVEEFDDDSRPVLKKAFDAPIDVVSEGNDFLGDLDELHELRRQLAIWADRYLGLPNDGEKSILNYHVSESARECVTVAILYAKGMTQLKDGEQRGAGTSIYDAARGCLKHYCLAYHEDKRRLEARKRVRKWTAQLADAGSFNTKLVDDFRQHVVSSLPTTVCTNDANPVNATDLSIAPIEVAPPLLGKTTVRKDAPPKKKKPKRPKEKEQSVSREDFEQSFGHLVKSKSTSQDRIQTLGRAVVTGFIVATVACFFIRDSALVFGIGYMAGICCHLAVGSFCCRNSPRPVLSDYPYMPHVGE